MNHTPGPWTVGEDREEGESLSIEFEGAQIATVHSVDDFTCVDEDQAAAIEIESVANANLISKAPDFDALAREFVDYVRDVRAVLTGINPIAIETFANRFNELISRPPR